MFFSSRNGWGVTNAGPEPAFLSLLPMGEHRRPAASRPAPDRSCVGIA